ncbi:MAG: phage minor head protein [Defluviitaleaceae bacterium]|nr:phage minor head protein [Defluviitaleaceae bacterium]
MFKFTKARGGITSLCKADGVKEETLQRLRAFLDAEEPRTMDFLTRFWDEQREAISYADIRHMLVAHNPSSALLARWRMEYAQLVNNQLAPEWEKMMHFASAELKRRFPGLIFDPATAAMREYIRQRTAEMVTLLSNTQVNAVRSMIEFSAHPEFAVTADVLSRVIRPTIGLTVPQAKANLRYWNAVWMGGVEEGLSPRAAEARADRMAATYAARQHRYRAMNIARTELAMAYNEGAFGAVEAAQEQGYIGDTIKIWLTADDERVCPICAPLDGVEINMNAFFAFPANGAGRAPAPAKMPPAHPQCRCAVDFVEVTSNLQPRQPSGMIVAGGDGMVDADNPWGWLSTATEEQKIQFFGGKTKAALFDAGLLAPEDFHRPLRDIDLRGIEIPGRSALNHAIHGDFNRVGRITGGAHGYTAIARLRGRGIIANTTRTTSNGVVFGNIPSHKEPFKRVGELQAWFPETWSEQTILSAGIATANRGVSVSGRAKEFVYQGVNVRVLYTDGIISSIAPSYNQ